MEEFKPKKILLSKCFDETLRAFRVTNTALGQQTGLGQGLISEWRRGVVDSRCSTLEELLAGLEAIRPGALYFFCWVLAGHEELKAPPLPVTEPPSALPQLVDWEALVAKLDPEELGYLLYLVGDRLAKQDYAKRVKKKLQSRPKRSRSKPKTDNFSPMAED